MPRGARNPAELELYLNKTIELAVNSVAEQTLKELYEYVETEWYQKSPYRSADSSYERTGDYLRSLDKSKAKKAMNKYVSEVFSNPDKISPQYQDGLFNAHKSIDGSDTWNGIPIVQLMAGIIEEGINSPYKSHSGIAAFKATSKWLDKKITILLKAEFKKRGLRLVKS
jgi:hypothetical protein